MPVEASADNTGHETGRQGVTNRQARLIDGAIFPTGASRYWENHNALGENRFADCSARSSPVCLSWTSTRQNPHVRLSWLQGVRSAIHQNKQKLTDRLQPSVNSRSHARNSSIMSILHRRVVSVATPDESVQQSITAVSMGFDGTFDFDELSPAKLPLNVHKPLPNDPPPDRVKPALTIGVAPSFTYSQDTTFRPSTASTTSTGITTSSSRRAFGRRYKSTAADGRTLQRC